MTMILANNASSTLALPVTSASQTTLTLKSGDGDKYFPSPSGGDWFPVTLDDSIKVEICKCTARSGDVLTVVRAQEGTAAASAFAATATAVEIRATAWGIRSAYVYSYDLRASLRSLSPVDGAYVIVDGLGLFTWEADTSQPDDDETCFATSSPVGRWLLRSVHWDVVFAIINDELEALGTRLGAMDTRLDTCDTREAANATFRSRFLTGSGNFAATGIASASVYTFTATVPGALVGAAVVATPPSAMNFRLAHSAWVSSVDTVTIQVTNNNATAVSTGTTGGVPQGDWSVLVVNP